MVFKCFFTLYRNIEKPLPATIGYNATKSLISFLENYKAPQFIHSGNWWNIKPEKRTKEVVLDKSIELTNKFTSGIMSMNVQPGNNQYYWIEDEKNESHLQVCLDNAIWARDELERRGVDIPLYCTLQPSTVEMARRWFQKALDDGFNHLSMGVSEFLRSPKYRKEGIKRVLSITREIAKISKGKDHSFHLSGFMSFNLLPIVAILGATSTDGSTPVQSGLAYGTIFFPNGKGMQVNKLIEKSAENEWNCGCAHCKDKTKEVIFNSFKDRHVRVQHNLNLWEGLVNRINTRIIKEPRGWFEKNEASFSPRTKKHWERLFFLMEN
ncbi:MAG: hypothetical protein ACFFCS_29680 [Candidatus Hodarchaeota archaeon]